MNDGEQIRLDIQKGSGDFKNVEKEFMGATANQGEMFPCVRLSALVTMF